MLCKSGIIICVYASNLLPVNTVLYPIRLLTSDQMILMLYAGTNVMWQVWNVTKIEVNVTFVLSTQLLIMKNNLLAVCLYTREEQVQILYVEKKRAVILH